MTNYILIYYFIQRDRVNYICVSAVEKADKRTQKFCKFIYSYKYL